MLTPAIVAALLLQTSTAGIARNDVCFAGGDGWNDGGANPFDACLTGEQFGPRWLRKYSKDSAREWAQSVREWVQRRFPTGSTHPAWTRTGANALRVSRHSFSFELGDHAIGLEPASKQPVLVASGAIDLTLLRGVPATLSKEELSTLQAEARRIWNEQLRRLSQLPDPDQPPTKDIELGTPDVVAVSQHQDLRTVVIPATFVRYGATDDRGSFFFLINKDGIVAFARFGHPEWNVAANSNDVSKISPVFFFRLGGGSATFLLATYEGPWEATGLLILDADHGRIATSTF